LLQQASAQKTKFDTLFTLKAKMGITHIDSVFLFYEDSQGQAIFRSLPIFNDSFMITDSISYPMKAHLMFKDIGEKLSESDIEKRSKEIYLEPGLLTLTGNPAKLSELKLEGSESQLDLDELNRLTAPMRAGMQPLIDLYDKEKDPEKADLIQTKMKPYEDQIKAICYQFFITHPNSYVTVCKLQDYADELGPEASRHIYKNFNDYIKLSPEAKKLDIQLKKIESTMPGNMAANFTTTEMDGKSVSLTDFRGCYVLLDFWSTWHAPARRGNTELIELYKKYKDKGLQIIGIADDDETAAAWKKAVAKDGIGLWPNVLSGANTPDDINEKYSIHAVPTKVLIDPAGKIIARFGDSYSRPNVDMEQVLASEFRKNDELLKKAEEAQARAAAQEVKDAQK